MPNNNPYGTQWPDEHTEELARLAKEGLLSYRKIAVALNEKFGTRYNRNATIGKAHRIGLKKGQAEWTRRPAEPKKESPKPKRVTTFGNAKATRVYSSVQVELRCVDIEPRHLALLDLEAGDCRYPYGDGQITFCGHPTHTNSNYCAPHHFLCWERPRAATRRQLEAA